MKNEPTEITLASTAATRQERSPRPTRTVASRREADASGVPSPVAFDEVFAKLARRSDRRPAPREVARPASQAVVAAMPDASAAADHRLLDPAPLRQVAAELDHQHERLAQLLRDIEAETAAD